MTSRVFCIDLPPVERNGRAVSAKSRCATLPLHQYLGGRENRLVQVVADALLGDSLKYNPAVLFGPTGTGKSLLLRGLFARWTRAYPHASAVLTSGADFARDYAAAVDTNSIDDFRRRYRHAGLLVIDDLHLIGTKEAAQLELTHTLDNLLSRNRRVLVALPHAPAECPSLAPSLASRLCSGLTVPLVPPAGPTKQAILERLLEALGMHLPESVVHLLTAADSAVASCLSTVPQLQNAVLQLSNLAESEGQPLDERLARRGLELLDPLQGPELRAITTLVCRYFNVRASDLKSPTRQQRIVRARGVAMLLARQLTGKSLEQVGRHFGNRDHTTVMHACRKTESLMVSDPSVRQAVDELLARLSTV